MKVSIWLTMGLILMSCGKNSSVQNKDSKPISDPLTEQIEKNNYIDVNGTYVAVLNPINADTIGFSSGAVTVNITDDNMITNIRFNGSSPMTLHSQSIHVGSFCPSEIADTNMDGYIDISESHAYTSNVLIPLDADTNSQIAGEGIYPVSDAWGTYIYSLAGSFKTLMSDLYLPDENTNDDITKLIPGAPLLLEEKVIVIYGTLDTDSLPSTVSSSDHLTSNQSLPIACGTFSKVVKLPGTLEPDEVNPAPANPPRPKPENNKPIHNKPTPPQNPQRPQKPQTSDRTGHTPNPLCRRDKTCL
jgi:hypothetical protein